MEVKFGNEIGCAIANQVHDHITSQLGVRIVPPCRRERRKQPLDRVLVVQPAGRLTHSFISNGFFVGCCLWPFLQNRTRRLKCGEERPHCKRCIRAGLQCGGYEHVDSDSSHGFHTFALRPNESPTVSVPGQAPSRIRKASRALISIRQVGNRPVCQNCW